MREVPNRSRFFGAVRDTILYMNSIDFFESEEIADKSWKIHDIYVAESSKFYSYLVEGKDYALLIDTMMGWGKLDEYCKTLTNKPIKVVNTHSHWDHIGGNFRFDSCYLHPRDIPFFLESLVYTKQQLIDVSKQMAKEEYKSFELPDEYLVAPKPMKIFPIYDGDIFDLGDRQLEVVEVGGHTAGSIVLIDHKTRIAYAGDVCNGNTLLELPTSLPVEAYLKNLHHLNEHRSEFDMMYGGHEIYDSSIIDEAIETVSKVIDGTDAKCERTGMFGTPVYYAAQKKEDSSERVDGKRFNMSYLPNNIFGTGFAKQVIKNMLTQ